MAAAALGPVAVVADAARVSGMWAVVVVVVVVPAAALWVVVAM